MPRGKIKLARTQLVSGHHGVTDCRSGAHGGQMLRHQAGITTAHADVGEAKGALGHYRQAQCGPQDLAAAFAMGAVEGENVGQGIILNS